MNVVHLSPILNVSDVPASLAWFESLGWKRTFTWNNGGGLLANDADRDEHGPADFAGLANGKCEMFLCLNGQGARGPGLGTWMSWWVCSREEVDEAYATALAHGMQTLGSPADEPWNVREFKLVHPDGHTIRVGAGTAED
jgi:uncharacterized glyoxalase superfamily protein PhnB